jgi:hypothetical protein
MVGLDSGGDRFGKVGFQFRGVQNSSQKKWG